MRTTQLDELARHPGRRRPAIAVLASTLVLASVLTSPAAASTADRPSPGRFVGEHTFNGSISLKFERRSGIGLHVSRYKLKGTVKCPDVDVPLVYDGLVTARTAARVKGNGRFRLRLAGLRLDGRFVSSRRIKGDLQVTTLACEQSGGFAAARTSPRQRPLRTTASQAP